MNMMNDRKAELEIKIDELELTLATLKSELVKIEAREQHEAIDNLDKYLVDIDSKYSNLKLFWQVLREEAGGFFASSAASRQDKTENKD